MKLLAKYYGRVNKFNPPPELSYVTLKEESTGKVIDTSAVSQKLIDAGIGQDDQFEVVINESIDGKIIPHINKAYDGGEFCI